MINLIRTGLNDVVWFPEGAGGDRFDEKIFKGPLSRMTRDALSVIQRNYLIETVLKQCASSGAFVSINSLFMILRSVVLRRHIEFRCLPIRSSS